MLIPRYSLRWLLGLTTLCAGASLILSYAIRGQSWAIGAAAALACILVLASLYVGTFLAAWLLSQLESATFVLRRDSRGVSPFATLTPPDSPLGGGGVPVQTVSSEPPSALTG